MFCIQRGLIQNKITTTKSNETSYGRMILPPHNKVHIKSCRHPAECGSLRCVWCSLVCGDLVEAIVSRN